MAQRITLSSVRTAVLGVLAALFAVLGLRRRDAAPAVAVAEAPSRCAPARGSVEGCRQPAAAPGGRRAVLRGGALPPTIKQRIRAEAHGKNPSARGSVTATAVPVPVAGAGAGAGVAARTAVRVGSSAARSLRDSVAEDDARLRFALAA
ncbi:DUF6344 domain-containing protein [Streptomyces sp. NPDC047718]|uniref:DUF6344 domain-containing protein n=1 Tax=Streptomyces sp. NPDC047718 TaxID=3155479 RepID=UPI003411F002